MYKKQIVLAVVTAALLAYFAATKAPMPWTAMQWAGVVLAVIGFALMTLARFQLGRSFTITPQARQLVTRGLYARIRNPVYVFGGVMLAGYVLLLRRPQWLLLLVFFIPLQLRRARREAQVLEAKFG